MQKHHVQLPELRLRCVAHYHEIVREYETSVDFRSKQYDQYLRSASSASSSSSSVASLTLLLHQRYILIPILMLLRVMAVAPAS